MGKDNKKGASKNAGSLPHMPDNQQIKSADTKEEISLELAELGNLNPTHEPMTSNHRKKSEVEKTY